MSFIPKHKRIECKKYLQAAKNQECTFNGPTCNHDIETTVAAHLNGGGWAYKHHDLFTADCCSNCHSFVDHEWVTKSGWTREEVEGLFIQAVSKTMANRFNYQGFSIEKKS